MRAILRPRTWQAQRRGQSMRSPSALNGARGAPRGELAAAIEEAKPGIGPDDGWATADLDVNDDQVVDRRDLETLAQGDVPRSRSRTRWRSRTREDAPVMVRTILTISAVALPIAACAQIAPGDPTSTGLADSDVSMASQLVQTTLEQVPDGVTRRWTNDQTGNSGEITPLRTYATVDGISVASTARSWR